MHDGLATLETQLHEKDELVRVLTARLEQAAEQLDRFRRTGSSQGPRQSAGVPNELLDQQQSLVDDLKKVVEEWVESQPGEALFRIENQLAELREMVAEGLSSSAFAHPPADVADEGAEFDADGDAETPLGWEKLKAEILAKDDEPAAENPLENVSAVECPLDEELGDDTDLPIATAGCDAAEPAVDDSSGPEPPAPVDLESATDDELRHAVENRDEYILFLIKKVQVVESRGNLATPDWSQLQEVPEELQQRLEELESRLEELLRISEVEISLKRARLSREETRLKQIQHEVEKQVALMGKTAKDRSAGDSADAEGAKGRRWLKFLGAGKDETSGE